MATKPKTKTIRVSGPLATKLQTISSLKSQMGERFRVADLVDAHLQEVVDALFDATTQAFAEWLKVNRKPTKKPS